MKFLCIQAKIFTPVIAAVVALTIVSACKKDAKETPQDEYTVTALADNSGGYAASTGTAAQIYASKGLATDARGNIYISEYIGSRIRKISKK